MSNASQVHSFYPLKLIPNKPQKRRPNISEASLLVCA
nr:MAG TPA: hypothetical protein [Caudoviricetes sp.]